MLDKSAFKFKTSLEIYIHVTMFSLNNNTQVSILINEGKKVLSEMKFYNAQMNKCVEST